MALPAILAKLVETVAAKVAETAAAQAQSQAQVFEKVAAGDKVSFSDIREAAESLRSDGGGARVSRAETAPDEEDLFPSRAPDEDGWAPYRSGGGRETAPDRLKDLPLEAPDGLKDAPEEAPDGLKDMPEPEGRSRRPADPRASSRGRNRAPENRRQAPEPETETPESEPEAEPETGGDPEARLEHPGPEVEEPSEPEAVTTASDFYDVGLRPHEKEFDDAVEKLSRQIEDSVDEDPSFFGVLRATVKQTALDVADGSHAFVLDTVKGLSKVGEGTARGLEEDDLAAGVFDDLLGASSVVPAGKVAKIGVVGGKATLNGARKGMAIVKKSQKAASKAEDAARKALRNQGPKTGAQQVQNVTRNSRAAKSGPAPAQGAGARTGSTSSRAGSGRPGATPKPNYGRFIPKSLTPAQVAAAKRLMGQRFNPAFKSAWNAAVKRSPKAQERMREAKRLMAQGQKAKAQKLARMAYDSVRGKFWNEVRKDPKLAKAIRDTGMEFPQKTRSGKVASTAPYYKSGARKEYLSLEHTTRVADDPARAIDPDNFVFAPAYENSVFLEFIRKIDPFQLH